MTATMMRKLQATLSFGDITGFKIVVSVRTEVNASKCILYSQFI